MKYKLLNTMERKVIQSINDTLPQLDCCNCARCRADIAAYTLSRIPPQYVTIYEGEPIPKAVMDEEQEAKIQQTIAQAVDIISSNPNHA